MEKVAKATLVQKIQEARQLSENHLPNEALKDMVREELQAISSLAEINHPGLISRLRERVAQLTLGIRETACLNDPDLLMMVIQDIRPAINKMWQQARPLMN